MKKITAILMTISAAAVLLGCAGLTPKPERTQGSTGINIINEANSNPVIVSGTNNSQINTINDKLEVGKQPAGAAGDGQAVDADGERQATISGLFTNVGKGDRSADVDAAAAIKLLHDVRGTTAAQSQATTKGDESPGSVGDAAQQAEQKEDAGKSTTVNVPISAGQAAKSETTGGEEAAPATEQNN